MSALGPTLQAYFTDRLISQRRASPNTISGYRDTFRLLLTFTQNRTGKTPTDLDVADLDAPLIAVFLDHLERERRNSVRTRNNRLAAIHSFFHYAALRHPEHAATIAQVLAIPAKRYDRTLLTYLSEPEVDALLGVCDRTTRTGRRDHALFLTAIQTGLRISELISLNRTDVVLSAGAHVHCTGKGRKERRTPLTPLTRDVLRVWLTEHGTGPEAPLFPSNRGTKLSRDAIEHRLHHYTALASRTCPTLANKRITAHTLRHTAAMRLLEAGIDITVIALWLGHEQVSTTNAYLHADMTQKEQAIARTASPTTTPGRYQPSDQVIAFLESL